MFHPIRVLHPAVLSSGQVWEPRGRRHVTGQRPRVGWSGWYTLQGVSREVTAVLERPLGNRVLLDITGAPVTVTPEHLMTGPVWAARAQRASQRGYGTQR